MDNLKFIMPKVSKSFMKRSSLNLFTFMMLVLLIQDSFGTVTLKLTDFCKELSIINFSTSETNYPSTSNKMTLTNDPLNPNSEIDLELQMTENPVDSFTTACYTIEVGSDSVKLPKGNSPSQITFKYKVSSNPNSFSTYDQVNIIAFYNSSTTETQKSLYAFQQNVESVLNKTGSTFGFAAHLDDKVLNVVMLENMGDHNIDLSQSTAQTCSATATSFEGSSIARRNCILEQAPLEKWFVNKATYNTGTWMLVGISTFFFIFLILLENKMDMNDENLRENVWTLYPLYSIWRVGSDQYTKISKLTQIFIPINTFYLVHGLLVRYQFEKWGSGTVLGVGIGIGLVGSWIMNYITGCLLERARKTDRVYLQERKDNFSGEKIKDIREKFERQKFMNYYEYYLFCIIYVLGTLILNMVLLYEIEGRNTYWAFYGTFITWGIDILVFDMIVVAMGKSLSMRNWFAKRGFYFDYDFQESYNTEIDDL